MDIRLSSGYYVVTKRLMGNEGRRMLCGGRTGVVVAATKALYSLINIGFTNKLVDFTANISLVDIKAVALRNSLVLDNGLRRTAVAVILSSSVYALEELGLGAVVGLFRLYSLALGKGNGVGTDSTLKRGTYVDEGR
jgi:hypothetical protein